MADLLEHEILGFEVFHDHGYLANFVVVLGNCYLAHFVDVLGSLYVDHMTQFDVVLGGCYLAEVAVLDNYYFGHLEDFVSVLDNYYFDCLADFVVAETEHLPAICSFVALEPKKAVVGVSVDFQRFD